MLVIESLLIGGTLVLAVLAYLNYTHSSRILKQTRAQSNEIERLYDQAQQRYREILQAKDKAVKEEKRIASFWSAERLN